MKGVTPYHMITFFLIASSVLVFKGYYDDYKSKQTLERKSRDMVISSALSIKKIKLKNEIAEQESLTGRKSFRNVSIPNFTYSKTEDYSKLKGENLIKPDWINKYYKNNERKLIKLYEDKSPAKCVGVFTSHEERPPEFYMIWQNEKLKKNTTMTIGDYAKLKCRR